MLILLPLLFAALVFAATAQAHAGRFGAWRDRLVTTAWIWGLTLLGLTELLSLPKALTPTGVAAGWTIAVMAAAAMAWRAREHLGPSPPVDTQALALPDRLLRGAGLAVVLILLMLAIFPAPTNWDAMVYHLARTASWAQNRSIAPYPTHLDWQVYHAPLSEFALLHTRLLTGTDYFVGCVQWGAMVFSVLVGSRVAEQLGGDRRAQLFAGLLILLIPMGLLQSTSAQNDYAVTAWLVGLAHVLLRLREEFTLRGVVEAGALTGLAALTKATTYIYAFPMLLWVFVTYARQGLRWRPHGIGAVAFCVIFFAINGPHYARNISVFGRPMGPKTSFGYRHTNETADPRVLISGVMRNVALHMVTGSKAANAAIVDGIAFLHTLMGMDVNDPRTTWYKEFHVPDAKVDEDYRGNPSQLLMILAAGIAGILLWRRERRGSPRAPPPLALTLLGLQAVSFLIFCALLKWQSLHSRLHLPLFVLSMPTVALYLVPRLSPLVPRLVVLLLLLQAGPFVLSNPLKPVFAEVSFYNLPRRDQYFMRSWPARDRFLALHAAMEELGCHTVGFRPTLRTMEFKHWLVWEYPLWVLLGGEDGTGVRLHHIDVANPTARLSADYPPAEPLCAVIKFTVFTNDNAKREQFAGRWYAQHWVGKGFQIYVPEEQ